MSGKNRHRRNIIQWVNGLSVKKKLIFYGYVTISPVLFLICLVLFLNNYNKIADERLANDISGVNSLAEGVDMFLTEAKDISTYICINDQIHHLLTAENPERLNQDAKLWTREAPMEIVQDMISLKGDIKTIAIYPENGIRPYLRGMDASAYVSDIAEVRQSETYKRTLESSNKMLWKHVGKGRGETYETNRADKLVLYREIFEPGRENTLRFISIGVDCQPMNEMCAQILQGKEESALVLDKSGGELSRAEFWIKRLKTILRNPGSSDRIIKSVKHTLHIKAMRSCVTR